ncbi:MAG TPA: uracil-DNA glycosylase [Actinomycetota bacterium]|nr:uracil-DNA glycosylase [Actinomycetota bacterium]
MTLEALARAASGCTKCALSQGRTQVVFGSGNPSGDLMFVGEAPGFHEDKQGVPFVGAAGNLLNDLLGKIGLIREDVYIANVLKCRPPGNRDPLPNEIEACNPWLLRQIDLIDPAVICTLGNFSTQLLLQRKIGITRVRGQQFTYRGRTLIPTFHPAAVLHGGGRGGSQYQMLQQDLKLVRSVIDAARPEPDDPTAGDAGDDAEQLGLF